MSSPYEEPSTPDLEDVQQRDDYHLMVPVRISEPVQIQRLPSRHGVSRSIDTAAAEAPVPLSGGDQRRSRAQIIALTGSIYIGEKDRCQDGTAAIWPMGVVCTIEHTEQLYVRAVTDVTTVSIISENWAD